MAEGTASARVFRIRLGLFKETRDPVGLELRRQHLWEKQ